VSEALRILVVEDNPADAYFIQETLSETGPVSFQVESVSRLSDAFTRLKGKGLDLVLLDLGLPDSQGLPTFHKLRQAAPDLPVIVLTGTDDQELAVAAVRDGAQDYLIKGQVGSGLLPRAIRYAVERQRAEKTLRVSEELYRRLAEDMPAYICAYLPDGTLTYANAAALQMAGIPRDALVGRCIFDLLPPEESEAVRQRLRALSPEHPIETSERSYKAPDSSERVQLWLNRAFFDERGRPTHFQAIGQDITNRKMAEARMQAQLDELHRWQAVMLGREERNMKLKREVNELLRRLGEPIRYPSQAGGVNSEQ
jgi:PAS domain S-box-containing protein